MQVSVYSFDSLSTNLLYEILMLRQQVFVIEQQSIYADLDDLDQTALHLCAMCPDSFALLGYTRLRFDDVARQAKIERVVIGKHARGKGIAKHLMQTCIDLCTKNQMNEIKLSAQIEVLTFYESWGFNAVGEGYDDGGIEHKDMIKKLI